jgi:hypothetical protein
MNDALKGMKEMMNGINASLNQSIRTLPPEQQAELNKSSQELFACIPDLGDFTSGKVTAEEMHRKVEESRKNIMDINNKMTARYADSNNK